MGKTVGDTVEYVKIRYCIFCSSRSGCTGFTNSSRSGGTGFTNSSRRGAQAFQAAAGEFENFTGITRDKFNTNVRPFFAEIDVHNVPEDLMGEFNRAFDEQGCAEKPDLENLEFLLSIIEDRSDLVVLVAQLKSEILKLKFMILCLIFSFYFLNTLAYLIK